LRWLSSVIAAGGHLRLFPLRPSRLPAEQSKYAEQRLDGTPQLVISDAQTGLKGASKRIAMLFMDAKKNPHRNPDGGYKKKDD